MSKNVQRYYTLKCLKRDLLSNVFVSDLLRFLIFGVARGMRRVQISCFIFFLACERAEFSKSCNLIGSGSGRKFSILPAHRAIPPGKLAVFSFRGETNEPMKVLLPKINVVVHQPF